MIKTMHELWKVFYDEECLILNGTPKQQQFAKSIRSDIAERIIVERIMKNCNAHPDVKQVISCIAREGSHEFWIEVRDCPINFFYEYVKLEAKRNNLFNFLREYPCYLNGSAKQIEWAGKIRNKLWNKIKVASASEAWTRVECCLLMAYQQTSSAWWIANRECSLLEIWDKLQENYKHINCNRCHYCPIVNVGEKRKCMYLKKDIEINGEKDQQCPFIVGDANNGISRCEGIINSVNIDSL